MVSERITGLLLYWPFVTTETKQNKTLESCSDLECPWPPLISALVSLVFLTTDIPTPALLLEAIFPVTHCLLTVWMVPFTSSSLGQSLATAPRMSISALVLATFLYMLQFTFLRVYLKLEKLGFLSIVSVHAAGCWTPWVAHCIRHIVAVVRWHSVTGCSVFYHRTWKKLSLYFGEFNDLDIQT